MRRIKDWVLIPASNTAIWIARCFIVIVLGGLCFAHSVASRLLYSKERRQQYEAAKPKSDQPIDQKVVTTSDSSVTMEICQPPPSDRVLPPESATVYLVVRAFWDYRSRSWIPLATSEHNMKEARESASRFLAKGEFVYGIVTVCIKRPDFRSADKSEEKA